MNDPQQCPECPDGVVVIGHREASGHQTATCSTACGWTA